MAYRHKYKKGTRGFRRNQWRKSRDQHYKAKGWKISSIGFLSPW